MSLEEYLIRKGIDDITDDEVFMEEEYHAVHSYCESRNYMLKGQDIAAIRDRGLQESYEYWLEFRQEGAN